MDDDGDACTYVSGSLVYLGRREADDTEQAVGQDPPLGTPMVETHGRRYTLSRSGITYRASGQTLREAVGAATARAVRDRLLAVKPKGGALHVGSGGVASLWVDGQRVFAGRISSEEWFPGHI